MATEYFVKIWDNNIIQLGIWQTVYMTALTTIFAYLIGLPLGVILWATDKDGLHPNKGVNTVLGFIVKGSHVSVMLCNTAFQFIFSGNIV